VTAAATIRVARFDDIAALLQIDAEAYGDRRLGARAWRKPLSEVGWIPLLATSAADALGYLVARKDDGFLEVIRCGVRVGDRGHGVCRRLLETLPAAAVRVGVREENTTALKAAVALGFRVREFDAGAETVTLWRQRRERTPPPSHS